MTTDTPNFNKISAAFEKQWGHPLISGYTYAGDIVASVFVTFDVENDVHVCTGYGETITDAIENLHKTIYERLEGFCDVAQ